MSIDLARRLIANGAVPRDEMQRALTVHVIRGTPLARVVLELGLLDPDRLDAELGRSEAPLLRRIAPVWRVYERLPAGMCARLLALPVRLDRKVATVDVAAVDPADRHIAAEFGYQLNAQVRLVRATLEVIDEALRKLAGGASAVGWSGHPAHPPIEGLVPTVASVPPASLPRLARPDSTPPLPLVRPRLSRPPTSAASFEVGPTRSSSVPPPSSGGSKGQAGGVWVPPPGAVPQSALTPAGPFPDIGSVTAAMRRARSRDEVIEQLLTGLRTVARRIGVFVARRGEYRGWRCNEPLGDPARFRELGISVEVPSVLATAEAMGFYLGPVPRTPAHAELLELMGDDAGEVAVIPLRVGGRVTLFLFLDDLGDAMIATRRAEDLGRLAGETLSRLLQREKRP